MENFFSIEKKDGINILKFNFNEITLYQRDDIKKRLQDILDGNNKNFVFDLSDIGFLSSMFIAIIVFFLKEVRDKSGDLKLCSLSGEEKSILQLTKLDKVFEVYDTPDEAVASFNAAI